MRNGTWKYVKAALDNVPADPVVTSPTFVTDMISVVSAVFDQLEAKLLTVATLESAVRNGPGAGSMTGVAPFVGKWPSYGTQIGNAPEPYPLSVQGNDVVTSPGDLFTNIVTRYGQLSLCFRMIYDVWGVQMYNEYGGVNNTTAPSTNFSANSQLLAKWLAVNADLTDAAKYTLAINKRFSLFDYRYSTTTTPAWKLQIVRYMRFVSSLNSSYDQSTGPTQAAYDAIVADRDYWKDLSNNNSLYLQQRSLVSDLCYHSDEDGGGGFQYRDFRGQYYRGFTNPATNATAVDIVNELPRTPLAYRLTVKHDDSYGGCDVGVYHNGTGFTPPGYTQEYIVNIPVNNEMKGCVYSKAATPQNRDGDERYVVTYGYNGKNGRCLFQVAFRPIWNWVRMKRTGPNLWDFYNAGAAFYTRVIDHTVTLLRLESDYYGNMYDKLNALYGNTKYPPAEKAVFVSKCMEKDSSSDISRRAFAIMPIEDYA